MRCRQNRARADADRREIRSAESLISPSRKASLSAWTNTSYTPPRAFIDPATGNAWSALTSHRPRSPAPIMAFCSLGTGRTGDSMDPPLAASSGKSAASSPRIRRHRHSASCNSSSAIGTSWSATFACARSGLIHRNGSRCLSRRSISGGMMAATGDTERHSSHKNRRPLVSRGTLASPARLGRERLERHCHAHLAQALSSRLQAFAVLGRWTFA